MNSSHKKYILSVLSIFVVFLGWQILALIQNDTFLFPNVTDIIKKVFIILTNPTDLISIFNTLSKLLIVISIAVILAIGMAFVYFKLPSSIHFFRPIVNILKAAPFAVISIYIFYAFDGSIAPGLVTFLVVLPIAFEGLVGAIDNINNNIKDDLNMLNINAFYKYIYVYIPICFPYIITTLLQSFGLGLKVMIMSEYMCQIDNTIGQILINIKYNLEFDTLLAWLIIIVAIVCVVDLLIRIISKKYNYKS
ncbi:MAG: ABC transporter permease subunit [Bacilli bacterium]|nr:ABC transporter permease subunit [Bacilli bacterium]